MKARLLFSLPAFLFMFYYSPAQEQAYLHFDRQSYFPGDTVFFKACLFYNQQPSYLSTNFYVAAYADDGHLLAQKQYPVFDGTTNGDIALPDSLSGHSIRIRVFTKGLMAKDSTAYFEQRLGLLQNDNYAAVSGKAPQTRLQFFPEGGHAIAGLQNQYAILATDSNGEPLALNGIIRETGNDIPADSFSTGSNGLGKLLLVPEPGKTYTAVYKDPLNNWRETSIVIPAADYYGVLLHLEQSGKRLFVNVLKKIDGPLYGQLNLNAYYNNQLVYKVMAGMKNREQWVSSISLDSLPAGILRFVLMDSADRELQSRLFRNQKAGPGPELTILKKNLEAKGETEFEISLSDSLVYNLSVSVTDIGFSGRNRERQHIATLQLEKSRFPFSRVNDWVLAEGSPAMVDLLLQTAAPGEPDYLSREYDKPLDNFLCLQALYQDKNYAMPAKNNLTLIITDSVAKKQFFKIPPASRLDFLKEGLVFYDSAECRYLFDTDKESSDKLALTRFNFFVAAPRIEKQPYYYRDSILADRVNRFDTAAGKLLEKFTKPPKTKFGEIQTMKTVVVKAWKPNAEVKRIQELDEKYTSGFFSGIARGFQFNLLDDKNIWGVTDVLSYLSYRVAGLHACRDRFGERTLHWSPGMWDCTKGSLLPVFVNEVELPDQVGLESIPITQIAYIKFMPGIVIGSSFTSAGGALFIYLKKGDETDISDFVAFRKKKIKGYDLPVDFTQPDYSVAASKLKPDKRTTLFWEPYLLLNRQQNKAVIRFYNNDVSKKLLLRIEGFNEEGRLIHIERIIE